MEKRNMVIVALYDSGKTFAEIGKIYNLSYQRILQIYADYNKEKYNFKTYLDGRNIIRESVRARDNYTCQKCGKKWVEGTRRLDVHHKDPEMEGKSKMKGIIKIDRMNIDKMITYCHKCHFSEHSVKERIRNGLNK